ncbi:MAG: hypothetical protein IJ875_02765 [Solobacterium sp.]|nr:hypothetical protein [Solobacterium sp.]
MLDNNNMSLDDLEKVTGGIVCGVDEAKEYVTKKCPQCGGIAKKLVKENGQKVYGEAYICEKCGYTSIH